MSHFFKLCYTAKHAFSWFGSQRPDAVVYIDIDSFDALREVAELEGSRPRIGQTEVELGRLLLLLVAIFAAGARIKKVAPYNAPLTIALRRGRRMR